MIKVKYDVTGFGWATFRVSDGKKIIQCPSSYMCMDTPERLASSAIRIQTKKVVVVLFQMESEEIHLVLVRRNDEVIDYLVILCDRDTLGYADYKECIIDEEVDFANGLDWSQELWDKEIDFERYYDIIANDIFDDPERKDPPRFEDTTWKIRWRWHLLTTQDEREFEAQDTEEYSIFNLDEDEDNVEAGHWNYWVLMKGTTSFKEYVSEIRSIFDKVANGMGFEKYDEMWGGCKFPVEVYEELKKK